MDRELIEELKAEKCFEKTDVVHDDYDITEFRRRSRLHQARWRAERRYAMGGHLYEGKRRPLGSRLDFDEAKRDGSNFLTERTREAVRDRIANPQKNQTLNEERLWSDLLSSMPMCFNLFGELWSDPAAAPRALKEWQPDTPGNIGKILFEWSPGRLDPGYLKNKSAFDAAFVLNLPQGKRGVVGVETKYHEYANSEASPKGDRLLRYAEVTERSHTFVRDWPKLLIGTDLQQLWLDHLLALSMTQHPEKPWSWSRFLLVYPEKNISFSHAANRYRDVLKDDSTFQTRTIEQLLDAHVLPSALERDFRDRYLW